MKDLQFIDMDFIWKPVKDFIERKKLLDTWYQKSSHRTTGPLKWQKNKDVETSIKEQQRKALKKGVKSKLLEQKQNLK